MLTVALSKNRLNPAYLRVAKGGELLHSGRRTKKQVTTSKGLCTIQYTFFMGGTRIMSKPIKTNFNDIYYIFKDVYRV
jgi:hypothetical protein